MNMIFLGGAKTTKVFFVSIFSLVCFILAGCMVIQQFIEYFSNQDITVITRKDFLGERDDLYPTISICLYGKNGQVFKRQLLEKAQMCRICALSKCTQNDTYLAPCGSREYFFAMSGKMENTNLTSVPFERLTYDAREMVLDHKKKNNEGMMRTKLLPLINIGNISWLERNYQDPDHICMQKKRKYESKKLLMYQYWKINLRHMLSMLGRFDIRIFVHQKGRFLRNLGVPQFTLDNRIMKNEKTRFKNGLQYKIDLQINAVDVLHKRQDSFEPCDDNLDNEDNVWIKQTIRLLNCTPPFFKHAVLGFGMNGILLPNLDCNKEKLLEFYSKYAPQFNFKQVAKLYNQPCKEMQSIVSSTAASVSKSDSGSSLAGDLGDSGFRPSQRLSYVELKLHYRTQQYKLAQNEKSFTALSLLSQVGGFIGIFLGYS